MNKNETAFRNFLENKMNEDEKKIFLEKLESSKETQIEFEKFSNIYNLVQKSKTVTLSFNYTQTIISKFRERLVKNDEVPFISKYRYAIVGIFILFTTFLIMTQVLKSREQDLQKIYSELSDNEISYFVTDLDIDLENEVDDLVTEKIDSIYNEKLNENFSVSLSENKNKIITDDMNLTELDKYLSDNDINQLYAELLEKKIL